MVVTGFFVLCKYFKCTALFRVQPYLIHVTVISNVVHSFVSCVIDILTLKVLVATIDALGHFETG